MLGVSFLHEKGFTFAFEAGYSYRLTQNVEIVSGVNTPEQHNAIRTVFTPYGLLLGLHLGYSF